MPIKFGDEGTPNPEAPAPEVKPAKAPRKRKPKVENSEPPPQEG